MDKKTLLIFNGSPRKKGTSYSFSRTIKELAENKGHTVDIEHIIEYFDNKKSFDELKNKLEKSEIIGIVAPLYVDSLPYPVIWFLERLSNDLYNQLKGKSFFAIGQCGFPDTTLCEPLLGSCRCFAHETNMTWLGGLGYGGGAIIDGAYMENLGKKGERITAALKLAIEDIAMKNSISTKAQEQMSTKIPKILYRPLAAYLNYSARKKAKGYGTNIERKFYLE